MTPPFLEVRHVSFPLFPSYRRININMMPIIFGDEDSVPREYYSYLPFIEAAAFEKGTTAYLTIMESYVHRGDTQRRTGIHTDGTSTMSWGGGGWGGGTAPTKPKDPKKGIYMASSDGRCRIWDLITHEVDAHGKLLRDPGGMFIVTKPETLYWLTDRTPHESLPALRSGYRQFFRLVADDIGVWWAKHNTPNPLGVKPNCRIEYSNKFA